jgi:hypothetical protein
MLPFPTHNDGYRHAQKAFESLLNTGESAEDALKDLKESFSKEDWFTKLMTESWHKGRMRFLQDKQFEVELQILQLFLEPEPLVVDDYEPENKDVFDNYGYKYAMNLYEGYKVSMGSCASAINYMIMSCNSLMYPLECKDKLGFKQAVNELATKRMFIIQMESRMKLEVS